MLTRFNEEALNTIKSNKLRSYALFKNEPGMENYLREIRNVKIRTQLTKFRLSDHHLMIEKGRHKGLDKSIRICPFCLDKVVDLFSYLMSLSSFEVGNYIYKASELKKFLVE